MKKASVVTKSKRTKDLPDEKVHSSKRPASKSQAKKPDQKPKNASKSQTTAGRESTKDKLKNREASKSQGRGTSKEEHKKELSRPIRNSSKGKQKERKSSKDAADEANKHSKSKSSKTSQNEQKLESAAKKEKQSLFPTESTISAVRRSSEKRLPRDPVVQTSTAATHHAETSQYSNPVSFGMQSQSKQSRFVENPANPPRKSVGKGKEEQVKSFYSGQKVSKESVNDSHFIHACRSPVVASVQGNNSFANNSLAQDLPGSLLRNYKDDAFVDDPLLEASKYDDPSADQSKVLAGLNESSKRKAAVPNVNFRSPMQVPHSHLQAPARKSLEDVASAIRDAEHFANSSQDQDDPIIN